MNQPTSEQVRWFWEKCGFQFIEVLVAKVSDTGTRGYWLCPDDSSRLEILPSVDLNNLFKYAVPRLDKPISLYKMTRVEFWTAKVGASIQIRDNNPALALFWAIWEVIQREKKNGS